MGYEGYEKLIGKRVRILAHDRHHGKVGVIRRIYLIHDEPLLIEVDGVQVHYRGNAVELLDEVEDQDGSEA